jgi:hypothetical protein
VNVRGARVALSCELAALRCSDAQNRHAVQRLLALRDEMQTRGIGSAISSWTCPSDRPCNPCGTRSGSDDAWGHDGGGWDHIACRTYDMTSADFPGTWRSDMNVSRMGVVTNIHIVRTTGVEPAVERAS